MRQQIVAGNWKMHGTRASVASLLQGLVSGLSQESTVTSIVFPPAVFLAQTELLLQDTTIAWGAQNVSASEPGAFTGELAAQMLTDFGCRYVLVGHSERRLLFGEDNTQVAMKFAQAQRYGLIPVLCVGETLTQRQQGLTHQVIKEQLDSILSLEGGAAVLQDAIVAYEPVWAIGTGMTATPEQAQEVHEQIRQWIAAQDADIASALSILYGGSVKSVNAADLFSMPDIDGGLVGGASLHADDFVEIVRCMK